MITDYYQRENHEALKEVSQNDPVLHNYKYRSFVSRSKGIRYRHGVPYQRTRNKWREVELVKYRDRGYHQWRRFPFDLYATETLPGWPEDRAIEYIKEQLRRDYGQSH